MLVSPLYTSMFQKERCVMARGRQSRSVSEARSCFAHVVNCYQLPESVQLLESPDGSSISVIRPNPSAGGFEIVMGPMACSTFCDICDGAVDLAQLATVSFGVPQE